MLWFMCLGASFKNPYPELFLSRKRMYLILCNPYISEVLNPKSSDTLLELYRNTLLQRSYHSRSSLGLRTRSPAIHFYVRRRTRAVHTSTAKKLQIKTWWQFRPAQGLPSSLSESTRVRVLSGSVDPAALPGRSEVVRIPITDFYTFKWKFNRYGVMYWVGDSLDNVYCFTFREIQGKTSKTQRWVRCGRVPCLFICIAIIVVLFLHSLFLLRWRPSVLCEYGVKDVNDDRRS